MKRIFTLIAVLFLMFSCVGLVYADDIPTGAFKGDYYNGQNFDSFVFTRTDPNINFNWWLGSPGKGVAGDHFSARWQGRFNFPEGDWQFASSSDDGIRVFLDGEIIIDNWKLNHGNYTKVVKHLSGGTHLIKVEYFENLEWAAANFGWKQVTSAAPAAPAATSAPGTTTSGGNVAPTVPPLYNELYVSSCEDLALNPTKGDAPLEVDFSGAGYSPYGAIQSYIFNFGDATPVVTQEDSYVTHVYQKPGTYNIVLTIKDSKGNLRTADVCKKQIVIGGTYQESVGGYAQPTVYPNASASALPKTGIFDTNLWMLVVTIPMAGLGLLLNRRFSKF